MNDTEPLMPELKHNHRVVLEHTVGPMKGIHSICGLKSDIGEGPLPEFANTVDMINSPAMRTPGPVSLVAVRRRYILYRQIAEVDMQNGKTFNRSQR